MKTAILFVLLIATVPAHGEGVQYSDPELHYSIKLPEGWRRLSSEALSEVAEDFSLHTGRPLPKYVAWFQRSDKPDGDYPYLLIGRQICRMPTLDELASDFNRNSQTITENANNSLKGIAKDSKLADAVIDTRRNMVLIEVEQSVSLGDTGKVKGRTCLFPGKAGVAQLNFYATADDFERSKADFDFVLNSVSFEPSFEYQSGLVAAPPTQRFNFDRMLMFALMGAVLGSLIYGKLKRMSPGYPLGLQRVRVACILLLVFAGLECFIDPPNGPFSLAFTLGCITIGFGGLLILWIKSQKGSSLSAGETPTDVPPSP